MQKEKSIFYNNGNLTNYAQQSGLAKMRAGRKNNRQQIVNQLWSFCIDVVKKLCRSDEHLSSQKKSHGLDEMLLSAPRQALTLCAMR